VTANRSFARVGLVVAIGLIVLAVPSVVLGHTLAGGYQSRLPLPVYVVGAAITVALSFAFVLVRDVRAAVTEEAPAGLPPRAIRYGLHALGLVAWLWILAQGIAGGTSEADVASLFVWNWTWVVVALISALWFPIWHWLDPFSTLYDLGAGLLRRLGVGGWAVSAYPAWLGRWPAVAMLAFFIWMELVLRSPRGSTLFIAVMGYTAFTLAMMAQFGRETWRDNGEVFNVWFRVVNRLAPLGLAGDEGRLRRRSFGTGLLEGGWRVEDIVLVALGTASILFDGLSQTAPWFGVFGSPSSGPLTIQLIGFLLVVVAAALLVARLVGLDSTGAGLLPIAVGYLIAHYLTFVLIDSQRLLIALSDPLQEGRNLVGTAFHEPTGAFLAPGLVWTLQIVTVVGGHMIGAWAGHVAAAHHAGADLRLRQVPLAVVMVLLTTVTLWSLGQAIVETPDDAASRPVVTSTR
jgi:hypothetical protein